MNFFKKSIFIKSVDKVSNKPEKHLSEVLFVGKSNVGKSSLINALVNNSKLAYTSSKPGHTRLLNYYLIEDEFYFVDCPGYGFSAKKDFDYEKYGNLVEDYFDENPDLKLIIFLLDSRHEPTLDDIDFFGFLNEYHYKYIICMTKCDKLNQSMKAKIKKNLNNTLGDVSNIDMVLTSIKDKRSIENLVNLITSNIRGKEDGVR